MKPFLSQASVENLWLAKLYALAPRLKEEFSDSQSLLKGNLKEDLGLDSLEIMDLASHFHGMFHLMEGDTSLYLLQYKQVAAYLEAIQTGANDLSLPISFFSSGSQGKPQACKHSKYTLLQEVETWQTLIAPSGKLWTWVQPHHIYGFLFSILLPDHTNLDVLNGREMGYSRFQQQVQAEDYIIGFPELYSAWLRSKIKLPAGLHAISSTAPLDPAIAQMLHQQGINILEIYGSSESGGIGYRKYPEESYELLDFWKREEKVLKRKQYGEELAYLMELPDHVYWQDDTHFTLKGRKDKAIQIGGINVYPQEIAKKMCAIPGVQQCWIRKMSPKEGNRLKCWIQTDWPPADWKKLEMDCYQWIEAHLSVPERPKQIKLDHKAPYNKWGKLMDWPLLPLEKSHQD